MNSNPKNLSEKPPKPLDAAALHEKKRELDKAAKPATAKPAPPAPPKAKE